MIQKVVRQLARTILLSPPTSRPASEWCCWAPCREALQNRHYWCVANPLPHTGNEYCALYDFIGTVNLSVPVHPIDRNMWQSEVPLHGERRFTHAWPGVWSLNSRSHSPSTTPPSWSECKCYATRSTFSPQHLRSLPRNYSSKQSMCSERNMTSRDHSSWTHGTQNVKQKKAWSWSFLLYFGERGPIVRPQKWSTFWDHFWELGCTKLRNSTRCIS